MRTLRSRLTAVYTAALLLGLLIFAGLSLLILDRIDRRTLDNHLSADIRAASALLELRHHTIALETEDRRQLTRLLGVTDNGGVFLQDGKAVIATVVTVPPALRAFALQGLRGPILATLNTGTGDVRAIAEPVPSKGPPLGAIVVWHTQEDIENYDRRAAVIFAIAIPLVVCFAMFFGGVVARRGLAPIRQLATLASEIEAHDLSERITISQHDSELGALGTSFNRMLDRLQAAFERQRRFTADASHELRGPIAVMRAEAELALRRPRAQEEYERTLQTIVSEADHVTALTEQLLAAARNETPAQQSLCDLSAEARRSCSRLMPLADEREITLDQHIEDAIFVQAEATALAQMLFAIVHNAVKFSPNGESVCIVLSKQERNAYFSVADNGSGFTPAALQYAFERFWRGDAARSRMGSGLGLSIAKDIAERMGGSIQARNGQYGGAVIDVLLPLAAV